MIKFKASLILCYVATETSINGILISSAHSRAVSKETEQNHKV